MNRLVACACLALSMSLVGSYVAPSKPLVAALPVFLLAWLRFGIGLASLSKNELATPVYITPEADLVSKQAWLGNLLLVGAVLCEAAYAVIGKKLSGVLGPQRITALVKLWGFALVTPLGLWMAWDFDFSSVAPSP